MGLGGRDGFTAEKLGADMRVDEAPGGQAGDCRLYPSRLKLWVSGKGAHILQDSLLDALDQSSCIRASFLCVITCPVLSPHVLVVRDPNMT